MSTPVPFAQYDTPAWSLSRAVANLGIQWHRELIPPDADIPQLLRVIQGLELGCADPDGIWVHPFATIKTAIHELAHVVLGHVQTPPRSWEHYAAGEVEAETVVMLVLDKLGMDLIPSMIYLNEYLMTRGIGPDARWHSQADYERAAATILAAGQSAIQLAA